MRGSIVRRRSVRFGLAAAALGCVSFAAAVGSFSAPAPARAAAVLLPPAVPTVGAYLGADPNFADGQPTAAQAALLARELGRPLGIVSFYQAFTAAPPVAAMTQIADMGGLPLVNVHCGTLDWDVAQGLDDRMLRSQAAAYRSYGRPVLLRWFWEMNLTKTSNHAACLGNPTNAARNYVAAFRHIRTVFHDAGATNVAFVWAPSDAHSAPDPAPYYPGDGFVDWIGADLYDRPGYAAWSTMFAPFYATWSHRGKPLILTETGAVGTAAQAAWLGDIRASMPTRFPDLHGVVYVDAVDLSDYRLVPGTTGFGAYETLGDDPYWWPPRPQDGWLVATTAGGVVNYGCLNFGSVAGTTLPGPIVGIAVGPGQRGYWLAGADGSVYAFGSAHFYGSMRGRPLRKPIVGIAPTADGRGYWLVASDGGIFSFGDAVFYGSMGGHHLNKPIVGIAVGPAGAGYWEVASDGGIFSFGTARFHGSTGGRVLNRPIVAMAPTTDDLGYWLVASDGGVFSFGDAHFHGSLSGAAGGARVVGIAADHGTGDYRVLTAAGRVYQFPAQFQLALGPAPAPAVAVATVN